MPRGEIAQMLGYLCSDWGGVNARADAGRAVHNQLERAAHGAAGAEAKGAGRRKTPRLRNQGLMMGYPDGTFKPKTA